MKVTFSGIDGFRQAATPEELASDESQGERFIVGLSLCSIEFWYLPG
jgi:hypothetical protein